MNKLFYFVSLSTIFLLFGGCNSNNPREKIGKGNVHYGDTLCFFTQNAIGDLFPLFSTDIYSHRVSSQIFETLLQLDPTSSNVVGNLVKKVATSQDNKKLTLYLRDDIYFHEDPCFQTLPNKLTAFDVKFSLDFACSSNPLNNSGQVLCEKIVGGEEYYNSINNKSKKGVSGIKVINDYCLEITLKEPYVNFKKLLTSSSYGIFSKIAYSFYGKDIVKHPIGSGAFIFGERTAKNLLLKFNPKYWKKDTYGNQLPYLNAIIVKSGKNKKTEFKLFRQRKTDVVFEVPSESLSDLLGTIQDAQNGGTITHRVLVAPGTRVSSIAFNLKKGPFTNPKLRRAFDYIINRVELCNRVLNGDGAPAKKGFAPQSNYYNNQNIPDREYNVSEAKKLLASSGMFKDNASPTIKLFVAGKKESNVYKWCSYIAEELKIHLGINTKIISGSFSDREKAIANNEVDAWNVGWVADYPDPEGYFSLFYVKDKASPLLQNLFPLLSSEEYNQYYYLATIEKNNEKRNLLFNKCDSIIKSEAIILPILIDDFVAIINLRVRNFKLSPLGLVDFSSVYIKELK
jgi:peptide/nickel transport system substrate-binding protein